MKKLTPLLAGLALAGAAVGWSAEGDLVHLSFSASVSSLELRGDQAGRPWDTGGYVTAERPLRLDLFYDPTIAPDWMTADAAHYTFTDPDTAYWRVRTRQSPLAPFDIIRPIDSIDVYADSIAISFWRTGPRLYETFDLLIPFDQPLATGLSLPTPPLPGLLQDDWSLVYFTAEGGQDMFHLPDPGSGTVSAIFTTVRAEYGDTFSPVPEPAAYGWCAAAGLGLLAGWRRIRRGVASA